MRKARVAVIVPAHNEELLLSRVLSSLRSQDYPAPMFSVHVIADNCDDRTAEIARSFGATTHERNMPELPGKGQAIAWLLPELRGGGYEAYVFIDADSTVDRHFLTTISSYLERGELAFQTSYRVANPETAPLVALRSMAFGMMHELRGRAKERLRLSCGLWGNGMVLTQAALDRVDWRSFSSVEDAEEHLLLIINGVRVSFIQEASVYGYMPARFRSSRSQQERWEAGRLALLRQYWRPLLGAALRRNWSATAALVDLALPPLSVLVTGEIATAALAFVFGGPSAFLVASAALGGLSAYGARGCWLSGLKPRSYFALTAVPAYVLWKAGLYAQQLVRRADPAWIRTTRDDAA